MLTSNSAVSGAGGRAAAVTATMGSEGAADGASSEGGEGGGGEGGGGTAEERRGGGGFEDNDGEVEATGEGAKGGRCGGGGGEGERRPSAGADVVRGGAGEGAGGTATISSPVDTSGCKGAGSGRGADGADGAGKGEEEEGGGGEAVGRGAVCGAAGRRRAALARGAAAALLSSFTSASPSSPPSSCPSSEAPEPSGEGRSLSGVEGRWKVGRAGRRMARRNTAADDTAGGTGGKPGVNIAGRDGGTVGDYRREWKEHRAVTHRTSVDVEVRALAGSCTAPSLRQPRPVTPQWDGLQCSSTQRLPLHSTTSHSGHDASGWALAEVGWYRTRRRERRKRRWRR